MPGHVFYNTMPCHIPFAGVAGLKIVTRYPHRLPSLDSQILLFNAESGDLLAIMDANFITAMRTGAVAAHSIRLLSCENYQNLGFIGLGNTARATLKFLLDMDPNRTFCVRLLQYKDQEQSFIDRFKDYKNVEFVAEPHLHDVVRASEVLISSVTFADGDFAPNAIYPEGCTIVPIHTLGFQNCDLFFDRVYADDTAHVSGFKNFKQFNNFSEVSAVLNGKAPGRTNNRERILIYNIGISLHDIFLAHQIFQKITVRTANFSFNAPKEKFWI